METSLAFVQATSNDVPEITALVRAAYAHYSARIGRDPAPMSADYDAAVAAGQVLLARQGDRLLGVLVTVPHADYLQVENVAVDPTQQGAGIGGRLLAKAEEQARALGLGELRLYTNAKMTENLSYYPRRGYVEVGRRNDDGFDRVYFTRTLGKADLTGQPR